MEAQPKQSQQPRFVSDATPTSLRCQRLSSSRGIPGSLEEPIAKAKKAVNSNLQEIVGNPGLHVPIQAPACSSRFTAAPVHHKLMRNVRVAGSGTYRRSAPPPDSHHEGRSLCRKPAPSVSHALSFASAGVLMAVQRDTGLTFTWDAWKAEQNAGRHGVTFEEAASVFGDPLSLTISDVEHSFGEIRYTILGRSDRGRLVVVAHTDRGDAIRIISAREATRRERRDYEEEAQ